MDIDALLAKNASLEAERAVVVTERDALKGDYEKLRGAYDNVLSELEKLRRQIFGRKAEAREIAIGGPWRDAGSCLTQTSPAQ